MFPRVSLYLLLTLVIFSCKKEDHFVGDDQASILFTREGASFSWRQMNSPNWPLVSLTIPADAVIQKHNLEFYTYLIDSSYPLDSFSVNFGLRDINFFRSTSDYLLKNATMSIPFPSSLTFSLSYGYIPYKIKLNGTADIWMQLNNAENWTAITNFTWDNTAKTITFETDDLNACYVIAKHL